MMLEIGINPISNPLVKKNNNILIYLKYYYIIMGISNSKIYENFTQTKSYPIIKAWYGNPKHIFKKHGINITQKISDLIKDNKININVSNALFGDPAPGKKKILVVEYYNINRKPITIKKYERENLIITNLAKKINTEQFKIINVGPGGPIKNIRVKFDTSNYNISNKPYNKQNTSWSDKFKVRKLNKNTISVIRIDKKTNWSQELQLKAILIPNKTNQQLYLTLEQNYKKNLDIYKTNNDLLNIKTKIIRENQFKIQSQKKTLEISRNKIQVKKRLSKYNLEETKTKNKIIFVTKMIILIILLLILSYILFNKFS